MAIDVDALKGQFDLRQYVAPLLGSYVRKQGLFVFLCPFHQESTGSFTVWEDHAHCYGCDWHGSIVDFVMQYENKSYVDAIYALHEQKPLTPRILKPQTVTKAKPLLSFTLVQDCFVNIEKGLPYFHQRQISDPTSFKRYLGVKLDAATCYVMQDGSLIWFKAERYAIPNLFGQQVRAINYRRNDPAFLKVFEQHPQHEKVLTDLEGRLGHKPTPDDILKACGGPKYRQEEGSSARIFNADLIARMDVDGVHPLPSPFLLIHAESKEFDTLALMDEGYPAIGIMPSAELYAVLPQVLAHIPFLYIIRDNDEAGGRKAERLQSAIGRGRIITPLEGHKDTGEVLQAGLADRWLVQQYGLERIVSSK